YSCREAHRRPVMGEFKPTAEIEELARKLAIREGRDMNAAVADALRRALEGRHETPIEAAERLRAKYGFELNEQARKPVDQATYDELGPRL
ncbi:MAG TPA: type II toxin-antitoxin system VapB family antitoxin, partial [Beijerinckiaceae bacterium]